MSIRQALQARPRYKCKIHYRRYCSCYSVGPGTSVVPYIVCISSSKLVSCLRMQGCKGCAVCLPNLQGHNKCIPSQKYDAQQRLCSFIQFSIRFQSIKAFLLTPCIERVSCLCWTCYSRAMLAILVV